MFDFEANATVKAIDAVPEQFRGLYEQDAAAGTYKLKTADPVVKGAVEAAVGLSRAIKAERAATAAAQAKIVDLAPLSEYGSTPVEIETAIKARIEELQAKRVDVDKLKADVAKGYKTEIEKRDEAVKRLRGQLEKVLVDNTIRQTLGGKAHDPDLVIPFVKERVRVVDENGQLSVRVVDEQGTERHTAQGLMSINDLVEEMKSGPKYARLFKSEASSGSGAKPNAAAARSIPAVGNTSDARNSVDKIRQGLDEMSGSRR